MTKLTHKQKREKAKVAVEDEVKETPAERNVDRIVQREKTIHTNDEGYHFVRPAWHRWVYGGGKQKERE